MIRLERSFEVEAPREAVWTHLARVPEWPSWARHIRSIELDPPGLPEVIGPTTRGVIDLKGGPKAAFQMQTYEPPDRWLWVGDFLWLRVEYDHFFEALTETRTRVRFVVDVHGFGASTLGRLFRAIYARNLDRALPLLQAELAQL